jgi:hypothetical protein
MTNLEFGILLEIMNARSIWILPNSVLGERRKKLDEYNYA